MSDNEVRKLISRIEVLEGLFKKYSESLKTFEQDFRTTLPHNCFHKGLVRLIQRHIDECYCQLRQVHPDVLEAVLS